MKGAVFAAILTCFASDAIAQAAPEDGKDPYRERLGIRAGWVGTSSGLKDDFGSGFDLEGHFLWRFRKPFSLDTTLGAFYMGGTGGTYTAPDGSVFDSGSVRVINVTIAPLMEFDIREKTQLYVSAGGGLYVMSLLLDEGFLTFDLTNDHLGVFLGFGLFRRISTNWFLEINGRLHRFWTSDDPSDVFFFLSNGDQDPLFYSLNAGFMLRLF